MSDRTVEAIQSIKAHAEAHGVIVDRIEVSLRQVGDDIGVEFKAFYKPKPLAQDTACVGYLVGQSDLTD